MKRELFVECIEALKKQQKHDLKVSKHLGKAFPNAYEANLFPENYLITDALIKVLRIENNDIDFDDDDLSWIEFFCYELDFGTAYEEGTITDCDGNIDLSDSGKLWDYLNKKSNPPNVHP